jgi:cytochrome bd-type quinol oxidase subunit 1
MKIQPHGSLLGYKGFIAFTLEATLFGAMLLGRDRAQQWFYFLFESAPLCAGGLHARLSPRAL